MKISRLESKLGYRFRCHQYLKQALSHRSIGADNNERLEFLGDSLLNFIIADSLCLKFPHAQEGDLSRLRATLVQGQTLAALAREFDLGEHLILGEGEMKSGGFRRASILADAVEALIGAIYLDSDFRTCQHSVNAWFEQRLTVISLENTDKDGKTRLQEYLQERKKSLPIYQVIEMSGEDHAREFTLQCRLDFIDKTTSAKASNKRLAEKLAAEKMLEYLSKVGQTHE